MGKLLPFRPADIYPPATRALPRGTVARLKSIAAGVHGLGTHPLAGRVVVVDAFHQEVGLVLVSSANGLLVWTLPSDVIGWPEAPS